MVQKSRQLGVCYSKSEGLWPNVILLYKLMEQPAYRINSYFSRVLFILAHCLANNMYLKIFIYMFYLSIFIYLFLFMYSLFIYLFCIFLNY